MKLREIKTEKKIKLNKKKKPLQHENKCIITCYGHHHIYITHTFTTNIHGYCKAKADAFLKLARTM